MKAALGQTTVLIRLLVSALLLCLAQTGHSQQTIEAMLVSDVPSEKQKTLLTPFLQRLSPGQQLAISVKRADQLENRERPLDYLLVLGENSLKHIARYDSKNYRHLILLLINQAGYRANSFYLEKLPYHTVLYTNAPMDRQLHLCKLLIPRLQTVGVLYDGNTQADFEALQELAGKLGLRLYGRSVLSESQISSALHDVEIHSDVILAIDNAALFNPTTIAPILLSSYRHNRFVIGLNAAYVEAGVLATTSHSFDAYARRLADIMTSLKRGDPPTGGVFVDDFHIVTNRHVARSLDLPLPDDADIEQQLKHLSESP